MAKRQLSFSIIIILLLSLSLVSHAHPNRKYVAQKHGIARPALPPSLDAPQNNSTNSSRTPSPPYKSLPENLQDFIKLLGWGLQWFGDQISQLTGAEASSSPTADIPSLVPSIAAPTWRNDTSATTVWYGDSTAAATSHITVISTHILTIEGIRTTLPAVSPTPLAIPPKRRIIVYAGSFASTSRTISDLTLLCQNPNIDIIALAAVTTYNTSLPVADFGPLCNAPLAPNATSPDCAALAKTLHTCQETLHKSLFLTLEVVTPTTTFSSAAQAADLAKNLWDTYSTGKATASGARKFGGIPINALGVAFDGFELFVNTTILPNSVVKRQDGEFVPPTLPYFSDFFAAVRGLAEKDGNRGFEISVSLPCTRPAVLGRDVLRMADFVSVRFFGDVECAVDGFAFRDFLGVWAGDVGDVATSSIAASSSSSSSTASSSSSSTRKVLKTTVAVTEILTKTLHSVTPTPLPTIAPQPPSPLNTSNHGIFHIPKHPHHPPRERQLPLPNHTPAFYIGIQAPSPQISNGTTTTGVGDADSGTLAEIFAYAKTSVPGFGGVMVWGPASNLLSGDFLGFVRGRIDGLPVVVANGTLTSSALDALMTGSSVASGVTETVIVRSTRILTTTMYRSVSSTVATAAATKAVDLDFAERPAV